jgi:hypothetical protein
VFVMLPSKFWANTFDEGSYVRTGDAIGWSQGGAGGSEPTCFSRFKTLQHTA